MARESTDDLHGDRPSASSSDAYGDRRELAATAFERTRMPMVMVDVRKPDYPIGLANKAFLELTGYDASEVIGRNCRFLQGPATSPTAIAEIRTAVRAEREANVEMVNYRKNGDPFWNRLHISPIHGDDGRLLYYFGSQIDTTDYRRIEALEASEHRLLMEVDHRSKNVMAVVDSIVRLSNADDPALYASAIQHRVQALAQAHGLLAERGWSGIPIEALVRQQVTPYAAERARLAGPPMDVQASIVQPLALVLHELAVNAARHGALTQPDGEIEIRWMSSGDGGGIRLRWQEHAGRPISIPRAKRGFGTIIVGAMVEKQLGGQFDRSWTDGGILVTIDIPAAS